MFRKSLLKDGAERGRLLAVVSTTPRVSVRLLFRRLDATKDERVEWDKCLPSEIKG